MGKGVWGGCFGKERVFAVGMQKELISDLMPKNRFFSKEIRDSCHGDQWEMQYQNKFRKELFQMAHITAE
jgi:hypothetical protein